MNKKLIKYINIFHSFTFEIGNYHKHEKSYDKRLENNVNIWIPMVESARESFLIDYMSDPEFNESYHEYMDRTLDFILFVNANVSAPDQRKYGSGGKIPFTAYWYQVVIWELYKNFSIAYYKSRDAGLSFGINSGESMMVCHAKASEAIMMSRVEKDVDVTGDRTQTSFGRIRQIIEGAPIYSMKNFKDDKYLRIYKSDLVGIFGLATTITAGSGNRVDRGLVDEAGKNIKLQELRQSLSMTATYLTYAGTLKAGTDNGLRNSIKESFQIDPLKIWNSVLKELEICGDYRIAWDKIIFELKEKLPKGKSITFKNTYKDHPLKSGDCDYREIECNRLFNDPVAIAHELDADLSAPSPDRTLYNATKANIKSAEFFKKLDKTGLQWVGGFDPGTIGTTCFMPILTDYEGRLYVMPKVYMEEGDMVSFTQKIAFMCPNMILYPEESVKAYSNVGSGWYTTLIKYATTMNFTIKISPNRDIEGIGLVTNYCLRETIYNPITNKEESKILVHEDNEEWLLNYQQGMKRSGDKDQKKWSHAAEAFMAAVYEMNKRRDVFKNNRVGRVF